MNQALASLDPWMQWLLAASWQAAVLVVLVIAVHLAAGRWLSARWRYALWSVVVLRLLMPVTPGSSWSVHNLLPSAQPDPVALTPTTMAPATTEPVTTNSDSPLLTTDFSTRSEPAVIDSTASPSAVASTALPVAPTPTRDETAAATISASKVLLYIWLLGAALLLGWALVGYTWLRRKVAVLPDVVGVEPDQSDAGPTDVYALLDECRHAMGVRSQVRIVETDLVGAPALMGILRPTILLPTGLMRSLSRDELRFVLLHELAHHRHCDIALNWLLIALQAIHWFNPLLWLGFAMLRADRELARDADVLRSAGASGSRAYGHTLLRVVEQIAHPGTGLALAGIGESKRGLCRRIRMIADYPRRRPYITLIGAALLVCLALVGLTDAAERESAETVTDEPAVELPAKAMELASGATVELLGVRAHPSNENVWWKPDGSPAEAPYADSRLGESIRVLSPDDQVLREFAVRLRGVDPGDVGTNWHVESVGAVATTSVKTQQQDAALFGMITVLPADDATCEVLFGVAAGPWKTLATTNGKGNAAVGVGGQHGVSFTPAAEAEGNVIITVAHDVNDRQVRVVAVDKEGKVHTGSSGGAGVGSFNQMTYRFNAGNVPLTDVVEFRFEARAYEWARFQNVALSPNDAQARTARDWPQALWNDSMRAEFPDVTPYYALAAGEQSDWSIVALRAYQAPRERIDQLYGHAPDRQTLPLPPEKAAELAKAFEQVIAAHPDDPAAIYARRWRVLVDWLADDRDAQQTAARLNELADQLDNPVEAHQTRAYAAVVLARDARIVEAFEQFASLDPRRTPQFGWYAFAVARYGQIHALHMSPPQPITRPGVSDAEKRFRQVKVQLADYLEQTHLPQLALAIDAALQPDATIRPVERMQLTDAAYQLARHSYAAPFRIGLDKDLEDRVADHLQPRALAVYRRSIALLRPDDPDMFAHTEDRVRQLRERMGMTDAKLDQLWREVLERANEPMPALSLTPEQRQRVAELLPAMHLERNWEPAADELAAMGPAVVAEMLPLLDQGGTDVPAMHVLKQLASDPQVQRMMLKVLDQPPTRTIGRRYAATLTLGASGNPQHVPRLLDALRQHAQLDPAIAGGELGPILAIAEIGGDAGRQALADALQIVTPGWLWFTAEKLAQTGHPDALPHLHTALGRIDLPHMDNTFNHIANAIRTLEQQLQREPTPREDLYALVAETAMQRNASADEAPTSKLSAAAQINLQDMGAHATFLYDMDTGQSLEAPSAGAKDRRIDDWARTYRLDLQVQVRDDVLSFVALDLKWVELNGEVHRAMTPEALAAHLDRAPEPEPWASHQYERSAVLSKVFVFQTREGGVGVLRPIRWIDDAPGIKADLQLLRRRQPPAEPLADSRDMTQDAGREVFAFDRAEAVDDDDAQAMEELRREPFTSLRVELTSTWAHNRTITIHGDGRYVFEMAVLENEPGEDQGMHAMRRYRTEYWISAEHLEQLDALLEATDHLVDEANVEQRLNDAVRYTFMLDQDGETQQAVLYGDQAEAYAALRHFIDRLDHQEWTRWLLVQSDRLSPTVHMLEAELKQVKDGHPPDRTALDYRRLLAPLADLPDGANAEHRRIAANVIELIEVVAPAEPAAPPRPAWSEPVNGLSMRVYTDRGRVEVFEDLMIHFEFRSVGEAPVRIDRVLEIGRNLHARWTTADGDRDGFRSGPHPEIAVKPEQTVLLKPGETYQTSWRFTGSNTRYFVTGPVRFEWFYVPRRNTNPDVQHYWNGWVTGTVQFEATPASPASVARRIEASREDLHAIWDFVQEHRTRHGTWPDDLGTFLRESGADDLRTCRVTHTTYGYDNEAQADESLVFSPKWVRGGDVERLELSAAGKIRRVALPDSDRADATDFRIDDAATALSDLLQVDDGRAG